MKAATVLSTAAVLGLLALPAYAHADFGDDYGNPPDAAFYDQARVVAVQPMVQVVQVPVRARQCWREEVEHVGGDDATGMVVGGIVGGVIGHQFGGGRGKDAATVAGTLLGAAIGRDAARNSARPYVTSARRCRVDESYREEQRTVGYRVTYRYHGQTLVTRMPQRPGPFIRVSVQVSPAWR